MDRLWRQTYNQPKHEYGIQTEQYKQEKLSMPDTIWFSDARGRLIKF
jgi:hypothetical protein